ncbi:hypothetical protein PLICRDRAFT_126387 [Plicaturopsis crispa FD-325 SS-3]|nr:hypothetical protein PLICRDRAFT_126387 [Plicaturopsis crispa FD-325 SS-3]
MLLGLWTLTLLPACLCSNGVHLPIYRRETRKSTLGRRGESESVGLGDYLDVAYNAVVKVGDTETSLLLDSGSSDLWVVSSDCKNCTVSNVPAYSVSSSFSSASPQGLSARLLYGDSFTGTHAYGPIGMDSVSVGGVDIQNQWFAAIDDTNTTVVKFGSAGILGTGFPANSVIWAQIFANQHPSPGKRELAPAQTNLGSRLFPDFSFRGGDSALSTRDDARARTELILASWPSTGPAFPRLAATSALAAPMYSVSLQRDTVEVGGNAGVLSIGALPAGVKNDDLAWAPVRLYTHAQGGLPGPPDSPNETYPIAWEISIDDVYLDGQKLARSTLVPANLSVTALVDTGNSLLRGPPDVVKNILAALSPNSATPDEPHFACTANHTLSFEIGGRMFPIDARDLVSQAFEGDAADCVANIVKTDVPVEGKGYLYSWSLGDPFLKSVLASFYYGNITYPSRDPPRIGFLSTAAADSGAALKADVASASSGGGNLAATSNAAPSGTISPAVTTNRAGAPQVQSTGAADPTSGTTGRKNAAALGAHTWGLGCAFGFAGVLVVLGM